MQLFKWFWTGSKWHFHVLWPSALHVCELMFSLSLFRGLHLSCHLLLFCFYFDHHMVAPCPFYFFSPSSIFFFFSSFLSFCCHFVFLSLSVVYQDGFYGATELYVSMTLPVSWFSLPLSFLLSFRVLYRVKTVATQSRFILNKTFKSQHRHECVFISLACYNQISSNESRRITRFVCHLSCADSDGSVCASVCVSVFGRVCVCVRVCPGWR